MSKRLVLHLWVSTLFIILSHTTILGRKKDKNSLDLTHWFYITSKYNSHEVETFMEKTFTTAINFCRKTLESVCSVFLSEMNIYFIVYIVMPSCSWLMINDGSLYWVHLMACLMPQGSAYNVNQVCGNVIKVCAKNVYIYFAIFSFCLDSTHYLFIIFFMGIGKLSVPES